uniref:RING-type E3 ubiquitin transferase n=2 Tax=Oncorhynchus mykiss TaxID=8022 RepID=A0A8C7SUR9_ONCMY
MSASTKSENITDHPCTFNGRPYHCPQSVQSAASPARSYLSMKSDQSMGQPINFRDFSLFEDHSQFNRSPSPCWSTKSDQSMDRDIKFGRDASILDVSALTASLLAEDHFRCSVCTEVLNEPVSIPCGHSFCRQCIETYWNKPARKQVYDCPGCQQRFRTCPHLSRNSALDKVIRKLRQTGFKVPALPPHRYAGPGDVACDLCAEKQLKAVKFCLTCAAFYCESHVRQHYTVAALQRHTLVEVTGNLDQKLRIEEQQIAVKLEAKLEQMNTEFAEEKTQKNHLKQNVKNPTTELICYAKRSSKDWATDCFVLAALGRPLDLGMMYDCCNDCLCSDVGLWDESTIANMRQSLPRPRTEVTCIEGDSLQDRFGALDVSTSLRASVLSGLVEVGGAAEYLNHPVQSKNKDRVTLQYRTTTRLDMLSRGVFEETVQRDSKATHVVLAVLYGAQAFFIFDKRVGGEKGAGGGEADMHSVIKKMASSFSADHMLSSLSDNEKINSLLYQCTLHSDVDRITGSMTYGQAVQALETLPKHLGQQGEKAVPLYAWLYPLRNLDTSIQITQGFLSEAEDVVEHLRQVTMRCQNTMTLLHVNDDVMKWFPSVKEECAEFSELLQTYQSEFKRGLAMAVKTVRESEEMDEKSLRDILQNHDQSPFCSQHTHQWLNNKEVEIKALLICKEKNIHIVKKVQQKANHIPIRREVQQKANNIPMGREVQEKANHIPMGREVQEKANHIPIRREVQQKANNIPTWRAIQQKANHIPMGREVQEKANHIPMGREVQEKANNIPTWREIQQKANHIPMGREVQQKANNIPTWREIQQKANHIPMGREVQQKANHIPTGKKVQQKANHIPMGREVQQKANHIPMGREVPTPNRTLCFTLTSLGGEDPYLSTMKQYIHSALETTTNQSGITRQQQTQHAFKPPDLTEKIQSDLHLFTTSNEDRRDGEKFNFLVAVIPDVTFPGSRIGLYQNGRLIGRNFKLGSKPNPAEVTEIKQTSFSLKFPQSKVMSPVKYRIEYTAESDVQWTVGYLPPGPGSVGPDQCNTCKLPGLKPDTKYQVRYSAVDSSSMSDFSTVTMVKTNPRSTPGQPCVKLVDGEDVRVTWRMAEEEDGGPVLRYAVEFKEAGLEGWSRVSTTGPERTCTLSQTSSTCYRVRVSAVYGEGDTSKPSTETDIPVKVWSIDLSQRKASFLLEVLKLQPEKKPVELKGWSDDESEVRSFLQCLPYISQLRFVNNNNNAGVIQFVLNLSVAAADHDARTGWNWSEFLSLVWSYSSFPFNEDVHPSDQCHFLLDLYSCATASGIRKGRSLVPLLRPVYQSAPAVWYVNLARRKASVFLEVLKLQPVKRPMQVKCWSDKESEVRSFLQCLAYVSQLSFNDNDLVYFLRKNREQAEQFAALFQAHGFTLSLGGELPRQTCTSVGRILALCTSGVKLGLTPSKISLRGASILFRHPLMLHNLILNETMTVKLTRLLATGRVSAPMGVEEISLVIENSQLSEDVLSRVLSSVASLLRVWTVQRLDLTKCTIHGHCLILLLGHRGPLKLKLCPDTLQQLAVVVHEARDKDLTHSFLKKVGGDLTSCRLDWEVLLSLLQYSNQHITVNLRENRLSERNITDLRPFLGRIILKSVERNLLLLFLHCYSASKIQPGATALLGALQHKLDFSSSVDLSTKDQGKPLCLSSADCKVIARVLKQSRYVTELILRDCEISDRALRKLLLKIPRRVNLSPSKAILVQLVQTCNKKNAVHHAGSLVRALGGEMDLSETMLDQKACSSLALVLEYSKGLSELDLSRCQLTDHHLQPLLAHLHKVQVLDLSHNAISNCLSKKILKAVSTSKGHTVWLTNNRMTAKPCSCRHR